MEDVNKVNPQSGNKNKKKVESISFRINGNLYKLPLSLNEVDIKTGIEILKYLEYKNMDRMKRQRRIISILCNIDMTELDTVIDEMIDSIYPSIDKIINECDIPIFRVLKHKKRYFGIIDMNKLNVEQYMDIDYILTNSSNVLEAGIGLMNILYRPIKISIKDRIKARLLPKLPILNMQFVNINGEYEIDKELVKEDLTNFYMQNISTAYIFAIYNEILIYKNILYKKYDILFPSKDNIRDNGLAKELEENGLKEEDIREPNVSDRWGWYDTINVMCDNNREDFDYWLNKSIEEMMTHLSYIIDKNEEYKKNNR